jgi:hypothetical protein
VVDVIVVMFGAVPTIVRVAHITPLFRNDLTREG